jgi:hypothetical protein
VPSRRNRLDKGLAFLQRRGVNKGVLGSSRGWFWVAVATWGLRRLRRAVGSEYELVYRGELKPGEAIRIDHVPETYEGRRVRSRRRKVGA